MKKYYATNEIILVFIGPLKTSEVLTSEDQMQVVTAAGVHATELAKALDDDVVKTFFAIGSEFMEKCGLITQ